MELKDRKLIANGVLPKFDLGLSNLPDEKAGLLKLENSMLKSGQFVPNSTGGLEPNMLAKKAGGAGTFLKNNAGGIANAAMSALNFASTIGGLSKNTMTADEMMGSGGQVENNANGISYQESRVDTNGIQDQINAQASAATMTGATSGASLGGSIGTLFGPLGTGIGTVAGGIIGGFAGLFGGDKAKREAERQKEIAINRTNAMNAQNRETAYTIGLRNEFNRENRTGISQSLFHAALGVEGAVNPITKETYKKHIVNTKYGKIKTNQNAWVSDEEVIGNKNDGYLYKVHGGKNDTARAYLEPGDSVYSKKVINPETGNPVAEDAPVYAAMGMLDRLDMNQNVGRMIKYTGRRKGNILPGYLGGTLKKFSTGGEDYDLPFTETWKRDADYLSRIYSGTKSPYFTAAAAPQTYTQELPEVTITPSNTKTKASPTRKIGKGIGNAFKSIGSIVGGLDFGNMLATANAFHAASQRDARAKGIRAPKSYMANPYENAAIDELNKLQSDYYTVWAGNREAEGRAKSAIAQSGGLGAGQRMLAYMGMLNQTQQNNAKSMFDAQNINNELKAQAAKVKLATGENSATRRQNAYHWDEDMLAKAHAAQLGLWEQSNYDRQNAIESFFHNRFKKNQFDRTMSLYENDQKIDRNKLMALVNQLNKKGGY